MIRGTELQLWLMIADCCPSLVNDMDEIDIYWGLPYRIGDSNLEPPRWTEIPLASSFDSQSGSGPPAGVSIGNLTSTSCPAVACRALHGNRVAMSASRGRTKHSLYSICLYMEWILISFLTCVLEIIWLTLRVGIEISWTQNCEVKNNCSWNPLSRKSQEWFLSHVSKPE